MSKNKVVDGVAYGGDFYFELEKILGEKLKLNRLIASLNHYFLTKKANQLSQSSSLVVKNLVSNSFLLTSYQEVLRKEVVSERSLQRLTKAATGLSPHELFEVTRFQKVINSFKQAPQWSHLERSLKFGYFDQAHYTKRIKQFSGVTPSQIMEHCRNYTRN